MYEEDQRRDSLVTRQIFLSSNITGNLTSCNEINSMLLVMHQYFYGMLFCIDFRKFCNCFSILCGIASKLVKVDNRLELLICRLP